MGCCCFILSEVCVKMIGCMCVLRASGWGAAVSFCQKSVSEVLAVVVRKAYCEFLAIDYGRK